MDFVYIQVLSSSDIEISCGFYKCMGTEIQVIRYYIQRLINVAFLLDMLKNECRFPYAFLS